MGQLQTQIIHVSIAVPWDRAYEFAYQPKNFSKWAAGLSESLHQTSRGWVAKTPSGEALVEFSPRNSYGVLDHWVRMKDRPVIYIPLRMIENSEGTEIELVLFRQPEMSDEEFERDAGVVRNDLHSLKSILESRP